MCCKFIACYVICYVLFLFLFLRFLSKTCLLVFLSSEVALNKINFFSPVSFDVSFDNQHWNSYLFLSFEVLQPEFLSQIEFPLSVSKSSQLFKSSCRPSYPSLPNGPSRPSHPIYLSDRCETSDSSIPLVHLYSDIEADSNVSIYASGSNNANYPSHPSHQVIQVIQVIRVVQGICWGWVPFLLLLGAKIQKCSSKLISHSIGYCSSSREDRCKFYSNWANVLEVIGHSKYGTIREPTLQFVQEMHNTVSTDRTRLFGHDYSGSQ